VCYHVVGRIHADNGQPAQAVAWLRKAAELRQELATQETCYPNARSDAAGSWYRLAEALESLGQMDDAAEAFRKCLAHQRLVYVGEPNVAMHRDFLDARLRQLFWLLAAVGRDMEALELAHERRTRWPNDPRVALSTFGDLAAAVLLPLCRDPIYTAIANQARRPYASEALVAMRDAARIAREQR
jgi:tetratricopeptide (TPR) repeat protein